MLTLNKDNLSELLTDIKEDLQDNRAMTKFAKESGINRVNLYGILKNEHRPAADKFLDLLNAAGYDVLITLVKEVGKHYLHL